LTSAAEIQIFVSTRPQLSSADADLARVLATKGHADLYTLRQRLQGVFPGLLARGSATAMEPLQEVLRQHGHPHWVVPRGIAPFNPETIEDLHILTNRVELRSQTQTIHCHPQISLLAIVADISGRLKERQLKRFLVRHTYGASSTDAVNIETLEQEIFRLSPVIDLYRLDHTGCIEAGIRITPGKFDHRRLGDDAGLSRQRNLETLWHKIRATNPDMKVHYSFGLAFLPDCTPETVIDSIAYSMLDNFDALTRYAWLMAELGRDAVATVHQSAVESGTAINQTPNLFAIATSTPGSQGIAPAQNKSTSNSEENTDLPSTGETNALPQPPEAETISGLRLYLNRWSLLFGAGIATAFGLGQTHQEVVTNSLEYLVSSGIAQGLLGVLSFGMALRYILLKRHIDNTPTSKIRSLALGMVEIHGRAERIYALVSPISGLPCVYYRIRKYKRKHLRSSRHMLSERGSNQWTLVSVTSSNTVPFIVHDDTGAVQIDPARADIRPRTTHTGTGARARLPFGVNGRQNENERWEEDLILVGSPIYILGFACTQRKTPTQTEILRQALKNLKQDPAQLQQYDLNGDGHIDNSEWDLARRATENQILMRQLSLDQESNSRICISRPPTGNYPFLIAETESELHLTRKLMYYSGLFLVVGLALLSWGLYAAC